MIPGTKEELLEESQIFTAGWQFMKKYANPVTDEDWTEVIQAAKDFPIPFKNHDFAVDMVVAIITQIEQNCKVKAKMKNEVA